MTDKVDANNDKTPAADSTDRPMGPLAVTDSSDREAFMRDMYALVAFFVAHPEVPLPHYISLTCRADGLEQVTEICDSLGGYEYGSKDKVTPQPQGTFDIPGTAVRNTVIVTGPRR